MNAENAARMAAKSAKGRNETDLAYVCARVRARGPRLLTTAEFERLRGRGTLAELFHDLLDSDYGPVLRETVLDLQDVQAFEAALTTVYSRRVASVRGLLAESVPAYVELVDSEWDLHHLRALVRRVARAPDDAPGDEAFVPLGSLTREQFRNAWAAESWPDLCDRLEAWRPDVARAFQQFLERAGKQDVTFQNAELFLESRHFAALLACVRRAAGRTDAATLRADVALLVDLVNLRTCVRFLGRHPPVAEIPRLYLAGGTLSADQFAGLLAADGIEQVYRRLPAGPLTAVLDRGMLSFASTGRPSVFERPCDEQRLRWLHRTARREPVSVAVPLYYLARARNEWINLKLIACGIRYSLPAGKVREQLVYA